MYTFVSTKRMGMAGSVVVVVVVVDEKKKQEHVQLYIWGCKSRTDPWRMG